MGRGALLKYADTCFENQESFMNAAIGDARKSEIKAVFASLAEKAGALDDSFTKDMFLAELDNCENTVKPAFTEHKIALGHSVYDTPIHVIDEKLVPSTESTWGADE
ncbi:unnamed protein product [Cylindrotheca closterium]|uniref:Uncharacterized protein n=1 Tax=Cylindrotheca closterium TaxID=2856 RepID=A0AAD2CLC3_9STRA|nr:unnamed protein product [Cylindrotheca closterium]